MEKPDVLKVLKRQFNPTLLMLQNLVICCPEDLWSKESDERPVWIQIYHVVFGIEVWFGHSKEIKYPDFGKKVTPVFEDEQHGILSKKEMLWYLAKVSKKVDSFFNSLNDKTILGKSVMYEKYTRMDSVLEQLRHVMYHVAQINARLKQHGHTPVEYLYFS